MSLHVAEIYWDPFTPGGVQAQVSGRLEHLGRSGGPARYTLFSACPAPDSWNGTRVVEIRGWAHLSIALWELTAGIRAARELERIHGEDPFDLIELHAIGAGPWVTRWARKRRVPLLAVCHSLRFRSTPEHGHRWEVARYYRWANSVTFRKADSVLAVSGAIRDELTAFGVPGSKIRVLHTAASPAVPGAAVDRDRDRFEILFVGRTSRDKGLDVLVEAISRIAASPLDRPVRLNIVGQLAVNSPIRRRIEEESLPIRLLGTLPNREARAWMAASDVLVVPSRYDPCPVVCAEALIEGCLTVATRVGGIPEVIEDGQSGLLVEPESAGALTEALRRIAKDPSSFEAMRARAREAGRRQTWEQRGPEIASLYRDVVSSANGRRP
jgi:glycosyltransferase involved in cell wall biosynthesis